MAAGEGEQDQDAPAEVDDDDLFDTPNIRRRSCGLEATAATIFMVSPYAFRHGNQPASSVGIIDIKLFTP